MRYRNLVVDEKAARFDVQIAPERVDVMTLQRSSLLVSAQSLTSSKMAPFAVRPASNFLMKILFKANLKESVYILADVFGVDSGVRVVSKVVLSGVHFGPSFHFLHQSAFLLGCFGD